MAIKPDNGPAHFCWLDLAATDIRKAGEFYAGMFDWQTERKLANGGELFRFLADGEPQASLYQLGARQIAAGVPSHWTPYIGVSDLDAMTSRATRLGGKVAVNPFDVDGMARVSLVVDSTGALVGLWEIPK